FFFSSRRRHTRSKRDWSSDVCSSDLSLVKPTIVIFKGRVLTLKVLGRAAQHPHSAAQGGAYGGADAGASQHSTDGSAAACAAEEIGRASWRRAVGMLASEGARPAAGR